MYRPLQGESIDRGGGGTLCRKFQIMFGENPLLENGQSSKSLVRQISIFDALSVERRCEMVFFLVRSSGLELFMENFHIFLSLSICFGRGTAQNICLISDGPVWMCSGR